MVRLPRVLTANRFYTSLLVVTCCVAALVALLATPGVVSGATILAEAFALPATGCPMAHCDPQMSDQANRLPPQGEAALLWHDPIEGDDGQSFGASQGLGCASNGEVAACTFGRFPQGYPETSCDPAISDTLVVYGENANTGLPERLWSSGDLLNCLAFTSAPLVGLDGDVVAADSERIVRFDAAGTPLWMTDTPGGLPISPVPVLQSLVALATSGGPVSLYDTRNGALIDSLALEVADGFYDTVNTPAVRGNRLYISTQHSADQSQGRLYAVDVILPEGYDPADPATYQGETILTVAWWFAFGGPSGASPLVVGRNIYFDGDRQAPDGTTAPQVFAVRDAGAQPWLLWVRDMPGVMRASFAQDPRGGFWVFSSGDSPAENRFLARLAYWDSDGDGQGNVLQMIDLDALVGEQGVHVPYSALTVAGTPEAPSLLLTATASYQGQVMSSFLSAIDLAGGSLLWKVRMPRNVYMGQFPIIDSSIGPRAFLTGYNNGLWVVGVSAP